MTQVYVLDLIIVLKIKQNKQTNKKKPAHNKKYNNSGTFLRVVIHIQSAKQQGEGLYNQRQITD